ncbi:hypothetical protein AUJ29_01860 [Candidatus Kuenenbacteria bacterium CG1_02_38_13]|uniref:Fibronectin type-III domain-containing protein n=1 Tax=Candidatus Kuenenbacteria bacterium CG1_02_38_13 TaxID=1805235 RepID=A0A1J4U2Z9_9BACT|nr:MAG: hypothetical protein AUJ29_01860 [Candidatus Kuenenbacteria bacterium CG1_02_38_13]
MISAIKKLNNKKFFRGAVLLAIFAISALCYPFSQVQAGRVDNFSDRLTRLAGGVYTDHEIKFKTKSGVSSSLDIIEITFGNNFGLSEISIDDVDLFSGSATGLENEKNLTASAAADRWGLALSGQVLTFTPPTNSAQGEVAINDYVVIRIGKNASGGINQIKNPNSSGIYAVSVSGAFGDSGEAYARIIQNDQVTVAAVVASGSGGPGSITPDNGAPGVSNIFIENLTSNSARIHWETEERSTGVLEYGLDTIYGSEFKDLDNLLFGHNFDINFLTQDTIYYFRIKAKDFVGNETITKDYFFKTLSVVNVDNFSAVGFDGQVLLEWQNPEIDNMAGVRIVRSEKGYVGSPQDGTVIYEGPGLSFLDRNVINGRWYFYSAFVYDTTRQYSSGALAEAVPLASGQAVPPKPEEIDIGKYIEIIGGLRFADLKFFVANETIALDANDENRVSVLASSLLKILLPKDKVVKKLKTIIADIGNSSYLLKIDKKRDTYTTTVSAPGFAGEYPIIVLVVVYDDGSKDSVAGTLAVEGYGVVEEIGEAKFGEAKAGLYANKVAGVKVTLFAKQIEDGEEIWATWNGIKYFQDNPQLTAADGEYGYMVPNGEYLMTLEKNGYRKSMTPKFEVDNNIVNWDLNLDRTMERKWYMNFWWWILAILIFTFFFWRSRNKRKGKAEKEKMRLEAEAVN